MGSNGSNITPAVGGVSDVGYFEHCAIRSQGRGNAIRRTHDHAKGGFGGSQAASEHEPVPGLENVEDDGQTGIDSLAYHDGSYHRAREFLFLYRPLTLLVEARKRSDDDFDDGDVDRVVLEVGKIWKFHPA